MRQPKGFVLIATVFTQAILLLAVVGYIPFYLSALQTTNRVALQQQALAVAEAGLAQAEWEVRHQNSVDLLAQTNGWSNALAGNPTACDAIACGAAVTSCATLQPTTLQSGDAAGAPIGTYQAWVIQSTPQSVRIIGRGVASAGVSQVVSLDMNVSVPASFNYALFGGGTVLVGYRTEGGEGPVTIDSYDSASGAYDPVSNRTELGDVGTGKSDSTLSIIEGSVIAGTARVRAGTTVDAPEGQPMGGIEQQQQGVALPPVHVPENLESLDVTESIDGFPGDQTMAGDFQLTGTFTCDQPLRVHQLLVAPGGELRIDDGCQLLIDGAFHEAVYHFSFYDDMMLSSMGVIFGTNTASEQNGPVGRIVKTGTGATQIIIREGNAAFAGDGLGYDAAVGEASRRPRNLQIQQTCGQESHHCRIEFMQHAPFYGVVYSENGYVALAPAMTMSEGADGNYFGSFVSGDMMGSWGFNDYELHGVHIHYDTDLAGMAVDGSGTPAAVGNYEVRRNSWSASCRSAQP